MSQWLLILLATPIACLLAVSLLSNSVANRHVERLRVFVTQVAGLQTLASVVLIVCLLVGGVPVQLGGNHSSPLLVSLYFDGASGLMFALVSFIGFVVSHFSVRYLDGEASQGRYFRWLAFTIGSVSLMVVTGNLLLFFVAWIMTSLGLHQLLLHYRHRPAAHRAAWTKFAISRLGDLFLIAALILILKAFGTFDLSSIFAQAAEIGETSQTTSTHAAIAWFLMLGAVTKSAQFPFHLWLPDTMETPTPVSALMHAGIVNAGGYLMIRMSPLMTLAPNVLISLAVIGAMTACFAGIVMMTQSSIKRTLAYSTVAQMGFMMLQCGLGAFSLAMLHILAHSLYKAHAFLGTGSVVSHAAANRGAKSLAPGIRASLGYLFVAAGVTVMAYMSVSWTFSVNIASKPGGLVLALIICLALTTWGWRLFMLGERKTAFVALAGVIGLCLVYVAGYLAVDHLLAATNPVVHLSTTAYWALIGIAAAFCLLFGLHAVLLRKHQPGWLAALRVHASNEFYVDAMYHRVFDSLVKS